MDHTLPARILDLPEAVRLKLAMVPGPGFRIARHGETVSAAYYWDRVLRVGADSAWWPSATVAAIRAVTGLDIDAARVALEERVIACPGASRVEAAVGIIEAHCARSIE